ncbi:MAG TPA: glycosyltransferase [Opitutus sp.]|nr:glycosyltransferase [Opitutus sp.]
MRCCQIIPSLEQRYGGPSRSVYDLSRALAALGHEVALFATDPAQPSSHDDRGLHVRIVRRGWPGALCPSGALRTELRAAACDVVHHHSLWLRTLHYAHRRAAAARVPLVISPRGMFARWALRYHPWRKRFARAVVHPGAFRAAAGWHATSDQELEEIRALGFDQPACIAPNAVAIPTLDEIATATNFWRRICPESAQRPTALFYGRFHCKKRVLELIDLWLAHAPADWLLLVVGLPDEYSVDQIDSYVLRNSGTGRVSVFDGTNRPPPYSAASLLLLPSHNENFGLVIAEAMAHGLPVVVTDTTPWSGANPRGAGWCVPWEDYPEALRTALAEGPAALAARGARAREWVIDDFSWEKTARVLSGFYDRLRAGTPA